MKSCSIWRGWALVWIAAIVAFGSLVGPALHVQAADRPAAATGYGSVAPILHAQCASCHNPLGGAPFNLLTYDDAKQWGGQILDVTQSRYMPPWLPAPGKGDFAGARRLSDADLAVLRAWVGAGMPAGSGSETVPPSAPPEWALGKPDTILTLTEPLALPANGPDIFTNLIVPVQTESNRVLRAIQVRPSDPQAVRSIWLQFDTAGKLQTSDGAQQGIAGMEPPWNFDAGDAGLIFWSAGTQSMQPRPGESWHVQSGSNLLLTTHLKTTGRKQAVQLQIGLYYATDATAQGSNAVVALTHKGDIEIPVGAANATLEDAYTLPQAATVVAIYPRAHFLARSFDAYATTPTGKQVWLLSIPKWDVDWLEVYSCRKPVLLPKGSVVHWKTVYDNSAENPHNPSDPPVAVKGGVDAKDEVDALLLELAPPPAVKTDAWKKGFITPAPRAPAASR